MGDEAEGAAEDRSGDHATPLWDSYRQAVVHLQTREGRLSVRADPAGARGPFVPGVSGAVHVLTGWNPEGVEQAADANQRANARLAEALRERGLTWWPADGAAADGSWHEDGFAVVGLSRAEACGLAAVFGQLAIYEWADAPDGFRLITRDGEVVDAMAWCSGFG